MAKITSFGSGELDHRVKSIPALQMETAIKSSHAFPTGQFNAQASAIVFTGMWEGGLPLTFVAPGGLAPAVTDRRSPEYMRVVRRRQVRNLLRNLKALADYQQRDEDEFAVFCVPVLDTLRDLITKTLVDAEFEGNTREVLRVVRDSLMDPGWRDYRREEHRAKVENLLHQLIDPEEVGPAVVKLAHQALPSAGSNLLKVLFSDGEKPILDRDIGG